MKEKAQRYFHGPEGYNCAQAVLKIFQEHKDVLEETIEEFSAHGGGRAPHGYCGALHSVLYLADESLHDSIKEAFKTKTGSLNCKRIRVKGKVPCVECVRIACEELQKKI